MLLHHWASIFDERSVCSRKKYMLVQMIILFDDDDENSGVFARDSGVLARLE